MVPGRELAAARGLLRATQQSVADQLEVSVRVVQRVEADERTSERVRRRIQALLTEAGVSFRYDGSVRLQQDGRPELVGDGRSRWWRQWRAAAKRAKAAEKRAAERPVVATQDPWWPEQQRSDRPQWPGGER